MFDLFQTVLTDVNLKSDINSRSLSFSMSTKYDFYKNDLYCSNMAFSGCSDVPRMAMLKGAQICNT